MKLWWLRATLFVLCCNHFAAGQSLEEAEELFYRGRYGEALEMYAEMDEAAAVPAAVGQYRCLRAQGKDDEARQVVTTALETNPDAADLWSCAAVLDFDIGKYAEARVKVDKVMALDPEHLGARCLRAQILVAAGSYEEANKEHEWFIHYYNDEQPTDPEALLYVAKAAAEFARWNKLPDEFDFILNELLVDAEAPSYFWPAPWLAGNILIEKYNKAEGIPQLRKALEINPSAVDAFVSLGTASLQDYDFVEGNKFADMALEINPRSTAALNLKADLLLTDSRTDAALEYLEKALAIHPYHEETLGKLAAYYQLRGKTEEVRRIEDEVLQRNPRPGVFYFNLADPLEKRRQFDPAEEFYGKAIAAAPHLAGPRNGLGMLYMRIGKEAEAKETFAEARALDPFHVRVSNMTKVLEHMESYKTIPSPHYELIVHPEKDELLGQYMSDFMEKKHQELCKLFAYEPPDRTKIEIMIDHKWFSARVVGLPSIGTVGACTGKVVAMASPRSLRSPYNWARVITHEVVHIITLQQTNFNIPHWYTEALAVLSEGYPRPPVWNELLAERVPKRDLLNLDTINHAFVRPKTPLDWQMAYCQSLLYAQFMLAELGEDSLAKLLNAYRDGMETDEAIPKSFGIPKEEFEKRYLTYLDGVVGELNIGEKRTQRSFAESERAYRDNPKDPDIAAELAEHHLLRKNNVRARELADEALKLDPAHPVALYVLAKMEWSIGKADDALAILEPAAAAEKPNGRVLDLLAAIRVRQKEYAEAAQLFEKGRNLEPLEAKWLEGLARVYLLQDDSAKLKPILEELARRDSDNLNVRKKLVELYSKEKSWEAAAKWAWEVLYIDVSDTAAHRALAEASLELKDYPSAARELTVLLSQNGDEGELRIKLAQVYLELGEKDKARLQINAILDRDPENEQATQLKRKIEDA